MSSIPNTLRGKDVVVVDVEGNGQTPPEIIEIAILTISGEAASIDDMRSWLIKPQQPITSIVTRKVHGITNSDVETCPAWSEIAQDINAALAGRTLVAHNAGVEQRVLASHLPYWSPPMVLDTLRLTKVVWPGLPSYSLDKLIAHAQLDTSTVTDQGYHRAGYDAWAAWQLLCRLVEDSGLDWTGLVSAAAPKEFVPKPEPECGLW
ncbi:exonuclease domain-containing protein [Nocardia sp. NPDC052566]|uniref:3'-5' exonuclease n=1 Tax=Nocardia sp. NPDC052566 TaxID=3364330 RepID=UPI0037CA4A7F